RPHHVGLGLPASRRRRAGFARVRAARDGAPPRRRATQDRLRERRAALRLRAGRTLAMKKTWRLYTGSDGQSHLEPIDIEKKADWLKGLPTTQISFSVWPTGRFLDWHPAPRRQFVIILSGSLEIGCGDGSKQVFGPGAARLAEDTTAKGHITRV